MSTVRLGELGEGKIQGWQRDRLAIVYVRQSSRQQVVDHGESTRLQYGLVDRAVALGWPASRVMVIDEDLGRSAANAADRPGFARLVAELTMGHVGLVLGLEMSRLARAGRTGGPPLPWTVTTLGSLGTGGTPMVTKYQKFGDGYKAEAVKLYRESNQTIAETARNLGLKESTLANWVKKDKDNEAVAVGEAPLTPAERTRIRELEADVRRLNMENAFLKKASAYFASQNL